MGPPSVSVNPYQPSRRALETFNHGKAWDLMGQAGQRPAYDPKSRPDGLINLSGAVNILMRDWLEEYTDQAMREIQVSKTLSYGTISGGPKLCSTMASFFNRFFKPGCPVEPTQIVATNGVTAMIDLVTWTLCEPGDAVMYLAPTFYMLDYDLVSRNGIIGVPVSTTGLDKPFGGDDEDIRKLVGLLENAADSTAANGSTPRMLFICNPSNPQGRCYSSQTLAALVRFCASRHMHLVADEIYALSHFGDEPFCSVLSVVDDQDTNVDGKQMIHGIYGLSKDFDMGGVRMGFLITRNTAFAEAIKRVTWFTWITAFSEVFVTNFFSRLDLVHDYVSTYQERISAAYSKTREALIKYDIPFEPATSGLFVFVNLGRWIRYFDGPNQADADATPETQLCNWLLDGGVFLNPGQFAFCDRPGHFRLVFTEVPIETVVLSIERIRVSLDKLDMGMEICQQRVALEDENCDTRSDDQTTLCVSESSKKNTYISMGVVPVTMPIGRKEPSILRVIWQKLSCMS
ncbi:pyridoxal phosphate-dependent transferase [Dactylonectria macrodidyma]|uniref:Pyridoxal phosphate-dependent transferase n=1 Tax=Dactylonectria macrodidyma TaxID=307937 RepID=A0A9P9FHB1_9HYPO|nr:pyridoxal phosphate-dependent transferase [Dactylonectria macrodidyma]